MILKPQDLLVTLKLLANGRENSLSFQALAMSLGMSASETHAGVKRARRADLVHSLEDGPQVNSRALEGFLLNGVRYVFVPDRGELTRGLPTAHAAFPMKSHIAPNAEPPPVWPFPEGTSRGVAFSPLYKAAPYAAFRDPKLYALLVIVDSLRGGRARERKIAETELIKRLAQYDG